MITYCGTHVTREFGVPNIRDIAVGAMRIPRFCGSTGLWWPVGMHLLLVADLLPDELEADGLLHDAAEICVNDVPRPMKTKAQRKVEHRVLKRIYSSLGLRYPGPDVEALVHTADIRAVNVEGVCELGPRGFADLQPNITPDRVAREALDAYIKGWNPMDAIDPNGYWPVMLERRLRKAIHKAHKNFDAVKSYTSPS